MLGFWLDDSLNPLSIKFFLELNFGFLIFTYWVFAMPEKLQELIEDYEVYVEQNGVIDLPADYNWAEEMTVNTIKRNYLPIIWRGILIVGIIIFAALAVFLMRRQRDKT